MVLATKNQIPERESRLEKPSKETVNTPAKGSGRDQLWAWNRRFKAQLNDLAAQIAVIKRDVARIDRAYYRSKEQIDETRTIENPQDANLLNPILFG